MRWRLPWARHKASHLEGDLGEPHDAWQAHVRALHDAGLPAPGVAVAGAPAATLADEQSLYGAAPSFVSMLPWVEYLPEAQAMLLDDGQSVAAF